MNDLRYPIGKADIRPNITAAERAALIEQIAEAPRNLAVAVAGLDDAQLDTPYREGGWTIRQVVHHVPDSHMNAYIRTKWALTERNPTIKAYEESEWAKLPDSRNTPIEVSLSLLDALHRRWVTLLTSLREEDFARGWVHPSNGEVNLDWLVQLYAWHGRHHVAHITTLRQRMGW